MKKLFMSALVAVMCLGFGATAFAASTPSTAGPAFSDIAGNDAEFALTALGALGIYTGDNGIGGAVKPDDPITRAQFCKVVVAAAGRSSTAAGLAGLQPTFSDGATIPTWAWGSVNVAVYMGIINGYADGSFGPNNPVTYAEAVTMLIRMVPGHAAQVGAGIWPYNFLFYGVDNGFVGGVDVGFANLPATRGDVAQMLFATMQINKLNAKGEELKKNFPNPGDPDTALLADRVEKALLREFDAAENHCQLGGTIFDLPGKVYLAGAAAATGLLNVNCIAVRDAADKICAIGKNEDASVVTGVFDDFAGPTATDTKTYFVLKDGTKVPYDGDEDYLVNGDAGGAPLETDDEVAITVDEDGVAAFVVATRFHHTDYVETITKSDADADPAVDTHVDMACTADFDIPANCPVTVNGAAAGRDTLAEFDVVQAAINEADQAVAVRVTRQVAEGVVAGSTTSYPGPVRKLTIGTKTYGVNDEDGYLPGPALPSKGDQVRYGLDAAGNLFVPIAYEPVTPFVLVKSFQVNGDGTASAVVDVRGVETTYKVKDNGDLFEFMADMASSGELIWIEVETGTGTIVDGYNIFYNDFDDYGYILSNGGGALTIGDNPTSPSSFSFIPADAEITVYKWDPETDTYTYADTASLPVTDGHSCVIWWADSSSWGFDGSSESVPAHLFFIWLPDDVF